MQAQIVNLLEELKARLGLTHVIISHGLPIVRHMSDRVAVMYAGEIVELAPRRRALREPLHPYTQALLAAVPRPRPRHRRAHPIEGDMPNPAAPPPGCRFHPRCPHARERCRHDRPALEPAGEGRRAACHFWREIRNAGAGPARAATDDAPSAALARRLALFEAAAASPARPR